MNYFPYDPSYDADVDPNDISDWLVDSDHPAYSHAVQAMRRELWANEYRPIPVYNHDLTWMQEGNRGKQPMGKGWQETARQNLPGVLQTGPNDDALNTGILCDGLRCVDIDIKGEDDEALARQVSQIVVRHLGDAPYRIRAGSSSRLYVYRAAEGEPIKRKIHDGVSGGRAVEVLGCGQQFVAFGTHKSGSTLVWPHGSPLTHSVADLPGVTESQIEAMLDEIAPLIGADVAKLAADRARDAGPLLPPMGEGDIKIDDVASAVAAMPADDGHDTWIRVLAGLYNATGGSADGLALAHEYSRKGIYDARGVDQAWRGFRSSPMPKIGVGTLYHLARQGDPNWVRPSSQQRPQRWDDDLAEVALAKRAASDARKSARVEDVEYGGPDYSDDGGDQPSGAASNRPVIQIQTDNLAQQVEQAEAALIAMHENVFQRGGAVVRNGSVADHDGTGLRRALKLNTIDVIGLIDLFSSAADWQRFDERKQTRVSTSCPERVAKTYLARRGHDWALPVLRGVIHSPTILRTGAVLETPGYHRASGLYYDPRGISFPAVPRNPKRDDAVAAIQVLDALLAEFPFTAEQDRAVALALILTGLVRSDLPTAPLFAMTAPTPGTGKSYLADITGLIATGTKPAGKGWRTGDDAENTKVLDAALDSGNPVLLLDNIEGELNNTRLNAMLTQETVSYRVMATHIEKTVSCNVLCIANGNNLVLPADMVRRSMLCRLDARMESPETRQFRSDPISDVIADRGRFVVAGLTVLLAYAQAGYPNVPPVVAGFEDWGRRIRGALVWLGYDDPVKSMAANREHDPKRLELLNVLAAWDSVYKARPVTTKELLKNISDYPELEEAVEAVAKSFGGIDDGKFGRFLRDNKDRVVSGFSLRNEVRGNKPCRWWVEAV